MLRRMLLAASDSDRARQLLVSAPLARSVVARYVAGDLAAEAVEVTGKLVSAGLLVTLDHLGEDTGDARQAAAVGDEYVALLKLLAAQELTSGARAEVSVKPTAVGLGLAEHGEKTAEKGNPPGDSRATFPHAHARPPGARSATADHPRDARLVSRGPVGQRPVNPGARCLPCIRRPPP